MAQKADPSISLIDTINVNTNTGNKQIQLCIGDITQQPLNETVDVIMVSAFPGDYSAVRGTLVGALHQTLGISVRELSKNKAEDMRKNFNCWISHPLPDYVPFKRLLCFEQSRSFLTHPAVAVGEIFRALFTVVTNKDQSVITPILASGNQNVSKRKMLSSLVSNCASWMRAGLQISTFKIVIYSKICGMAALDKISPDDKSAVQEFRRLKKRIQKQFGKPAAVVKITHDFYISYAASDEEVFQQFLSTLKKTSNKILKLMINKHFPDELEENDDDESDTESEKSFKDPKENRKNQMSSCQHVVTILTANFLTVVSCVEDYNLAMCLNHVLRFSLLAPMYFTAVDNIPTYMTMTQWIDCRVKREGDIFESKVLNGCKQLLGMLEAAEDSDIAVKTFQVFLSYAHRDAAVANIFIEQLKTYGGITSIFFDRDEIKTGFSWLETLYSALDNSQVVVALLSESYCASAMCKEEFSIAQLLQQDVHCSGQLLPVLISPIAEAPDFIANSSSTWTHVDKDVVETANAICDHVTRLLKTTRHEKRIDIDKNGEKMRHTCFKDLWKVHPDGHPILKVPIGNASIPKSSMQYDVLLSYHPSDALYARLLKKVLCHRRTGLRVAETRTNMEAHDVMQLLDQAYVVMPLLSLAYTTSADCMSQLYVALSRCRSGVAMVSPVTVSTMAHRPSFLKLLPVRCHIQDEHWLELAGHWNYLQHGKAYSDDPIPNVFIRQQGIREVQRMPNKCPLPPDVVQICSKDDAFGFTHRHSSIPVRSILALSCAADVVLLQLNKIITENCVLWNTLEINSCRRERPVMEESTCVTVVSEMDRDEVFSDDVVSAPAEPADRTLTKRVTFSESDEPERKENPGGSTAAPKPSGQQWKLYSNNGTEIQKDSKTCRIL